MDKILMEALKKERKRQEKNIELIASENYVSDQVLEAMGSVFLTAADLVVLCVDMQEGPCGVSHLVRELGLLQPTASMSVSALVDRGLLERRQAAPGSGHAVNLGLTEAGKARAAEVRELIEGIVVRRRRRGSAAQ